MDQSHHFSKAVTGIPQHANEDTNKSESLEQSNEIHINQDTGYFQKNSPSLVDDDTLTHHRIFLMDHIKTCSSDAKPPPDVPEVRPKGSPGKPLIAVPEAVPKKSTIPVRKKHEHGHKRNARYPCFMCTFSTAFSKARNRHVRKNHGPKDNLGSANPVEVSVGVNSIPLPAIETQMIATEMSDK